MILFTKEVFISLKTLHALTISCSSNTISDENDKQITTQTWNIYIQGSLMIPTQHGDALSTYISVPSKEKAYELYAELARQVVDSGDFPELADVIISKILDQ